MPLATPEATVPTPTSAASLTLMRARRFGYSVVEELREVFDDRFVVRRRRDEADAGRRVPTLRSTDKIGAGELSPSKGFEPCAICLQLVAGRGSCWSREAAEATC